MSANEAPSSPRFSKSIDKIVFGSFVLVFAGVLAIGGASLALVHNMLDKTIAIEKESHNVDFINHLHNKSYNLLLVVHHLTVHADDKYSQLATELSKEIDADIASEAQIRNATSFAKIEDELETMVIGIDKERGKISLGVKQLSEDPWESIARAYPRGSVIQGEVTNITDFGLFVRVQGGIEGLIHKMNIVDDRIEPVDAAMAKYKVGDAVQAVVTECSPSKQKLSLSLRDYARKVQREEMDKYIHDDSKEDTVALADLLKDRIKG